MQRFCICCIYHVQRVKQYEKVFLSIGIFTIGIILFLSSCDDSAHHWVNFALILPLQFQMGKTVTHYYSTMEHGYGQQLRL